jgi:uncharacterized DUF497 family protein
VDILAQINTFEWDEGNRNKNLFKHQVTQQEAEEVFFNKPHLLLEDEKHSEGERRFALLGKAGNGRKLAVVFTIRKDRLRIISVRDMSKKERRIYEKNEKNPSL